MKDGIYLNLDENIYHKELVNTHINRGGLSTIYHDSPRSFWFEKTQKHTQEKDTEAMIFGRLFHEAILEPEKFSKRTESDIILSFGSKPNNKTGIKYLQILENIKMVYSLENENLRFKEILHKSYKEVTIISKNKRCRIDLLSLDKGKISLCDLKTTNLGSFVVQGTNNLHYKIKNEFDDRNYAFQLKFYDLMLKEAIKRIQNGEDLHSDINVSNINPRQDTDFNILFLSKKSPYRHVVCYVENYIVSREKNSVKKAIEIFVEQSKKHNGLTTIWDDNHPQEIEYSGDL